MNKIRINLLPLEILEKRKGEKFLSIAILGVTGVFFVVCLAYIFVSQLVGKESGKLEALKANNARYEREIAKIADFENSKILVEQRRQLVDEAVKKKYSWSKLLNNVSLLIPNEVWINSMNVSGDQVKLAGSAYAEKTSRSLGQKTVAMWLVRLSELEDLSDVWLESAVKSAGALREPLPDRPLTTTELNKSDLMEFSIKAILTPLTEEGSVGSAPPSNGAGI